MTEPTPIRDGLIDSLAISPEGGALTKLLLSSGPERHAHFVTAYYKLHSETPLLHISSEDPFQKMFAAVREARALFSLTNNLISMYESEQLFFEDHGSSDEMAHTKDMYYQLREKLVKKIKPIEDLYSSSYRQSALYVMAQTLEPDGLIDTEIFGFNNIRKQLEACNITKLDEHLEYLENFITKGNDHEGAKKLSYNADLDNAARAFLVNVAFPRLRELSATIQQRIVDINPIIAQHDASAAREC